MVSPSVSQFPSRSMQVARSRPEMNIVTPVMPQRPTPSVDPRGSRCDKMTSARGWRQAYCNCGQICLASAGMYTHRSIGMCGIVRPLGEDCRTVCCWQPTGLSRCRIEGMSRSTCGRWRSRETGCKRECVTRRGWTGWRWNILILVWVWRGVNQKQEG